MIPLPSLTPNFESTLVDAAAPEAQLAWMHSLGKKEMDALWEKGGKLTIDHFVIGPDVIAQHEGQNSLLPGFDRFEKHFTERGGVVQGINVQFFSFVTGPGHFIAREEGDDVLFDYTVTPADIPTGWPALVPNDKGLSNLVYGGMIDVVRKVSTRICVGKAFRRGKDEGAFFMLYRR